MATPKPRYRAAYPQCRDCGEPHTPVTQKCPKYNGWTNYETWAVGLWLTNDQGTDSYWRDRAAEARKPENWDEHSREWVRKGTFTADEVTRRVLADWLKEELENEYQDILERARVSASLWSDLGGAALQMVNWGEVADGFLQE